MTDFQTIQRVITLLQSEDGMDGYAALNKLRAEAPNEVLESVVSLLRFPEETVRRRAGGALSSFRLAGVDMQPYAAALAENLEQGLDPRVRVSCAILLMSVKGLIVDQAYLHALRDPEPRIAQLACLEVGDRGGSEGTAALFGMLNHSHWRVRLEACKALITQKTAEQRVISTLESMGQEPEAAVYDAENEDNAEAMQLLMETCGHGDDIDKCWGKLDTIIRRARHVANQAGSDRTN
jgi:hypothetical protein